MFVTYKLAPLHVLKNSPLGLVYDNLESKQAIQGSMDTQRSF